MRQSSSGGKLSEGHTQARSSPGRAGQNERVDEASSLLPAGCLHYLPELREIILDLREPGLEHSGDPPSLEGEIHSQISAAGDNGGMEVGRSDLQCGVDTE